MEFLDLTHLAALKQRLAHEKERLQNARTNKEREMRSVWVRQIEKEIANEEEFLGIIHADLSEPELTTDELYAELSEITELTDMDFSSTV